MKIHSMLPFLDKDESNLLIDEVLEKKVDLKLVHVLPFADEIEMDHVIDRALNDDSIIVYMKHLLPFCNERQMNVLYDAYQEGVIQSKEVCENDMLPYLSKEKIKKIFKSQLKMMKLEIKEEIKSAIKEMKEEEK